MLFLINNNKYITIPNFTSQRIRFIRDSSDENLIYRRIIPIDQSFAYFIIAYFLTISVRTVNLLHFTLVLQL